jgi:zinc transport system permease protein
MFDEEFAYLLGIKTAWLEYLLFILIAMSVVVLIRVVGIILVLALFTAPPAIAERLTKSLKLRMIFSVMIGSVFCLMGLFASYIINIASGAVIVILAASVYLMVYIVTSVKKSMRIKKSC